MEADVVVWKSRTVRIRAWYEAPRPHVWDIEVPGDVEDDELDNYIIDHTPFLESFPVDWQYE